jgi:RNA polymerase sigma-70 factor (ECF subfamily)
MTTTEISAADVEALRTKLGARGVPDVALGDLQMLVGRAIDDAVESYGPIDVEVSRVVERIGRTIESHDPASEVLARLRGPDLVLACACAAGDTRAITALETRFQADVKRAFKRLRTANIAFDDFLQVFRQKLLAAPNAKIAEYGGLGDLRAWLRVVATRTALDLVRAQRRVERPTADDAILAVPTPADDPDLAYLKNVYGKEVALAIEAAAKELAPEERNVLREHYAQGLTIDQIGAVHGIHRATAARRVQRARETLVASARRLLGEKLGVSESELDSVMRLVQSELRISVKRVLEP